ncbi:uncharacterized protein FFUJ_13031 [Fusarium fujikuroi IMI 58289]|uniref:Uncharacterized protein n=1 Tax=Gibberella fujikuroi (strain CBS 195.34 / IMI 58289 / NRRL A-6831) TaxID=1279085 RepID=S0E2G1_GIBF5|nr:uncharacterized protein FFUJ_13031 [Fusarium fujikuroi IMI 58289]CCT66863.1 uncharacterized protein FFUJ_13031 [Fusarium fujikuroi IMI 58289]
MKHNSIVAYKVRLEDVRKHLRAKFNDQTIEVEAEKDEIYDLAP